MARKSGLQSELRQTRPFRSERQEAAVAILRTADRVRRHLTAAVASHGITLQQSNVLRILAGAAPDPLPTLEIADRLIEEAPSITGLLDRLERKGLVQRSRSRTDRRLVECSITAEGLRVARALVAQLDAADEAVVASLSPRRVSALVDILDEVRRGLS